VEYEVRDGYYVVAADGASRFDDGEPLPFQSRSLRATSGDTQ
jgi:hypothetical protein